VVVVLVDFARSLRVMPKKSQRKPRATRKRVTEAPRVYGDPDRFKTSIARHLASGDDLLDELKGVRRRANTLTVRKTLKPTAAQTAKVLLAEHYLAQWERQVERWRGSLIETTQRALADQVEDRLPTIFRDWPSLYGRPTEDHSPSVESWLRQMLVDLRQLRALLGVRRNVVAVAPGRFDELRASGLVDSNMIDGWANDITALRTPKQLSDAVGTAKEAVEATLRAALDRLRISWGPTDDLQQLMKKWRSATLGNTLDPIGARQLDLAQAQLGGLLAFISQWRNAYGRGHGRARYAPGLRAHHARLVVDAAETIARYVVLTMDDMGQLPPR
jgi:hypothetical protein